MERLDAVQADHHDARHRNHEAKEEQRRQALLTSQQPREDTRHDGTGRDEDRDVRGIGEVDRAILEQLVDGDAGEAHRREQPFLLQGNAAAARMDRPERDVGHGEAQHLDFERREVRQQRLRVHEGHAPDQDHEGREDPAAEHRTT